MNLTFFALSALLSLGSNISNAACCVDDSQLVNRWFGENIGDAHVDTSTGWGHAFELYYDLSWHPELSPDKNNGQCKLEWWEWADYIVPGLRSTGMQANVWYDHKEKNHLSPMWADWDKAQESLGKTHEEMRVRVSDYPALSLRGRRLVQTDEGPEWQWQNAERLLRIKVVVKNGSTECPNQAESYSVEQYLRVFDGQGDGGYLEVKEQPFLNLD